MTNASADRLTARRFSKRPWKDLMTHDVGHQQQSSPKGKPMKPAPPVRECARMGRLRLVRRDEVEMAMASYFKASATAWASFCLKFRVSISLPVRVRQKPPSISTRDNVAGAHADEPHASHPRSSSLLHAATRSAGAGQLQILRVKIVVGKKLRQVSHIACQAGSFPRGGAIGFKAGGFLLRSEVELKCKLDDTSHERLGNATRLDKATSLLGPVGNLPPLAASSGASRNAPIGVNSFSIAR